MAPPLKLKFYLKYSFHFLYFVVKCYFKCVVITRSTDSLLCKCSNLNIFDRHYKIC